MDQQNLFCPATGHLAEKKEILPALYFRLGMSESANLLQTQLMAGKRSRNSIPFPMSSDEPAYAKGNVGSGASGSAPLMRASGLNNY